MSPRPAIHTPGIPVMTKLEEALHADCDCGHDGLSLAFHINNCPFTVVRTAARLHARLDSKLEAMRHAMWMVWARMASSKPAIVSASL